MKSGDSELKNKNETINKWGKKYTFDEKGVLVK